MTKTTGKQLESLALLRRTARERLLRNDRKVRRQWRARSRAEGDSRSAIGKVRQQGTELAAMGLEVATEDPSVCRTSAREAVSWTSAPTSPARRETGGWVPAFRFSRFRIETA